MAESLCAADEDDIQVFSEVYLMMGKVRCFGLLAIAVVFCGCAGETDTIDANAKKGEPEVKVEPQVKVQPEVKLTKSEKNMVKLQTNMGDIVIELNEAAAPVTVKNFLAYVNARFYDGTIFHRVIPNFMIQGGGFKPDMSRKPTNPPIVNEASNGLKNDRGTISMARTNNPDSATSQFFINHRDNVPLNYVAGGNPGYAVFGKVVQGMDVVDEIAGVQTTVRMDLRMKDIPAKPVIIESAKVVSQ